MAESLQSGTIQARETLPGQRITSQRRLLLELIRQGGGHVDADELYRQAKGKEPRISLSTVYRTLRLFKNLGLVEERHFDEEHHHYEIKGATEHYHLICMSCGEVVEFESGLTERLKEDVGKEKGYTITEAEIHLAGFCPRCRRERQA